MKRILFFSFFYCIPNTYIYIYIYTYTFIYKEEKFVYFSLKKRKGILKKYIYTYISTYTTHINEGMLCFNKIII